MMENLSLFLVLFAALAIPLSLARLNITSTPTAVAEIVVGMLLGQGMLGVVHETEILGQLRVLGVIVLIFLSGMEIDFDLFKRQPKGQTKQIGPATIAILGYVGILIVAFLFSYALKLTGFFPRPLYATLVFATVALGVVIAALKEKELLSKPFGQTLLLLAALGEIVPLIGLTVYASLNGRTDRSVWWLSLIFVAAMFLLLRFRKPYQLFSKIDKSTTQLDIRLAFFLIMTLVAIAESVGAENVLGAFLAGMVMKLLRPREETQDKLISLGYGFFVPIFFIMTGVNINLKGMVQDPKALALIPLLLFGFLLAKAVLVPILNIRFKRTNAYAGAFLIGTTITLVIPALTIGRNLGIVSATQSDAFTLAALITCILDPIIFSRLYQPEPETHRKTRVHFIGANLITVPIAQQLSKGLYDITMYTDDEAKYKTYKARANVKMVQGFSQGALMEAGAYEADIVMLAFFDKDKNFQLAQWALAAKVPRIIARFEVKDVEDPRYEQLKAEGVELYNTLDASVALLRSLIDTPSTMKILEASDTGIFEVTVKNRRFTGLEIKNLPFVDAVTISQIFRNNEFIAPHGDTQIHLGDHIIFSGEQEAVAAMRREFETLN